MNARSGADEPKDPVRRRPADLIEPTVPQQERRIATQPPEPPEHPESPQHGELPQHRQSPQHLEVHQHLEVPQHPEVAQHRDPLEHPDPRAAADAAALENLLRCWVRETAPARPRNGVLRIPLPVSGSALLVPVRHWSPVGWHRFDPPSLEGAPESAAPLQAVAVAALIGREAAHTARSTAGTRSGPAGNGAGTDAYEGASAAENTALVGRVADSVQRTARFLGDRRNYPEPPPATSPFLDGEQALVFGHPLHPTPKSREGLSDAEESAYSPELRGSFPLHWMAVHRSALAGDSAWTDRGKPVSATQLALRLSGQALAGRIPEEYVPLPLHPWQAREVRHSPAVRTLLDAGLLHDLGQTGERWSPTSSVRTVFRPDSVAMLKLSVGLRITNSRRENLRKELLRGVEVHRLLRGDLGRAWRAAHPGFDIVRDPAWLGVDVPGEGRLPGFDTVIRHNPFGAGEDAVCLAGLTAPVPLAPAPGAPLRTTSVLSAPDPGSHGPPVALRSRLGRVIHALAQRSRRQLGAVAAEWFLRYLDAVVRPILWLDAHGGIALEAHQQNTVVLLDAHGWPQGGRYRDNQGYYFRASYRDALSRRLPGVQVGLASDTFVADDVTDERFAYYLGINNVLGLIGAFGSQRLTDERLLLAAFRRFLQGAAREEPASPLPALLLDSPTLRCKANLLTRLHGMDELVGPVDTQSVYVTLDNPLIP
ncbi:IucA/IucC family protein [Streptomyces sp. 8N114]|uniref:IucA/IucC family protein n=1 Tax=Streptomyces sp. 8N114 TaxID=3457419 RepID=UPI003FCF400C